jgi:DNA-binding transcriptional LysR family regulator
MDNHTDIVPARYLFEAGLKINHLRILVALQQLGQVQKVAEALHVTQPAISKQLREVESVTGVRLFQRSGNRIEFTVVGRHLARRAGEILQQLRNVETEISALAQGFTGTLAMGTITTAVQVLVPEAILRFRELAPRASIKLVESSADELFSLLEARQLDLVVARLPGKDGLHPGLSSVLLNDPLVLCCSVRHPLASRPQLEWADLAGAGCITPTAGSPAQQAFIELLEAKKLVLDMVVESISISANVAMVSASELLGLLPLSLARRLAQEGRVAILPLSTDQLLAQVSAHWNGGDSNPLTAIMTNCLAEVGNAM